MASSPARKDAIVNKQPAAPATTMSGVAPAVAWLVPGAGHLIQKCWIRGLLLMGSIVSMFVLACGGTIRAAELALDEGAAVHIGGGFHHAFAEKAEGFCYLNDLAVAIRDMQSRGKIQRAMVIDCDLHQQWHRPNLSRRPFRVHVLDASG